MVMYHFDDLLDKSEAGPDEIEPPTNTSDNEPVLADDHPSDDTKDCNNLKPATTSQAPRFLDHFLHVIQFCHLCHLGW
jgi:hypothetical protein